MLRALALHVVVCVVSIAGCTVRGPDIEPADDAGGGGIDASRPDVGPWGARMSGRVWGPSRTFPVSGALVAFYAEEPAPLPAGAYCERCVELPVGTYSTTSSADGTFSLQVPPGSSGWLLVQKGQFRIVTPFTAATAIGDSALDEALTTLPTRTDPTAGHTIPRIALVYGDYDAIQDVLAKAGLGTTDGAYGHAWGSEAGVFDVFDTTARAARRTGSRSCRSCATATAC